MRPEDKTPSPRRFRHHYTVTEAQALVPDINRWLHEMRLLRQSLDRQCDRIAELLHEYGDQGGLRVGEWVRNIVRARALVREFSRRDLQLEDLDRGLVSFPSIRGDREILLSWEEGDDEIAYWKEIGSGPMGREKMD
jgi:hypothetical protein